MRCHSLGSKDKLTEICLQEGKLSAKKRRKLSSPLKTIQTNALRLQIIVDLEHEIRAHCTCSNWFRCDVLNGHRRLLHVSDKRWLTRAKGTKQDHNFVTRFQHANSEQKQEGLRVMTSHGNDLIITTVQRTNQNTRRKPHRAVSCTNITVRSRLKMQTLPYQP